MGTVDSDLGFHVVWCRFRMLRGHMAYNSSVHELAGVYSLLPVVSAGAPGHGPVHFLLSSAASLGFFLGFGFMCLAEAWFACSLSDV